MRFEPTTFWSRIKLAAHLSGLFFFLLLLWQCLFYLASNIQLDYATISQSNNATYFYIKVVLLEVKFWKVISCFHSTKILLNNFSSCCIFLPHLGSWNCPKWNKYDFTAKISFFIANFWYKIGWEGVFYPDVVPFYPSIGSNQ